VGADGGSDSMISDFRKVDYFCGQALNRPKRLELFAKFAFGRTYFDYRKGSLRVARLAKSRDWFARRIDVTYSSSFRGARQREPGIHNHRCLQWHITSICWPARSTARSISA
jgi:hypothetical protein